VKKSLALQVSALKSALLSNYSRATTLGEILDDAANAVRPLIFTLKSAPDGVIVESTVNYTGNTTKRMFLLIHATGKESWSEKIETGKRVLKGFPDVFGKVTLYVSGKKITTLDLPQKSVEPPPPPAALAEITFADRIITILRPGEVEQIGFRVSSEKGVLTGNVGQQIMLALPETWTGKIVVVLTTGQSAKFELPVPQEKLKTEITLVDRHIRVVRPENTPASRLKVACKEGTFSVELEAGRTLAIERVPDSWSEKIEASVDGVSEEFNLGSSSTAGFTVVEPDATRESVVAGTSLVNTGGHRPGPQVESREI